MRPIAIIFAVAFLALGTGAAWLIANSTIHWVETSQKAELEQVFYAGGIDWAQAEADGFVITLTGEAENQAAQARAVKIAELIFAENLIDKTTFTPLVAEDVETAPPFVEILKNGGDYSLLGRMPAGETTRVLASFVQGLDAKSSVSNVTEPTEQTPDNWLITFQFALDLAPLMEQAILNVSPGVLSLEAVAKSEDWQQEFEEMAESLRPEGVRLSVDISAPRPVITPYAFLIDVSAPEESICSAQDEVEAKLIETRVERLIGIEVNCDVGIGAPSTHWRAAIELGLDALAGMGGGRFEIIDADVRLISPEGIGLQDFEIIAQILRFGLPDGFTLSAEATEAPPRRAVVEVLPTVFEAVLDADGNAMIKGAVKDNLTREVVMRFSEAKFGYGRVEDRLWEDESLPDGWQTRIFKLIEALALLNEGMASMSPEAIEISGDASFESPEAELGKLLAVVYTEAEASLNVTYTEPEGGEDGRGLDPRLCVSRITKILSENSIVFAPSSAVISDPSQPTIEAIAALLTQCREARIEIGGHTDSQGREAMNRALSQGRADAVLDALLAQNLLLGDLTAKGYGEAEPIADNGTEAGRAANRRIEFKLLRDTPEPAADPAPERVVIENFFRPAMRASSD